jgi:hypothetical protein
LSLLRRKEYREEDYLSDDGPVAGTVVASGGFLPPEQGSEIYVPPDQDPAGAFTDRSRDSAPRGPTESEVSIDVSDTEL